MSRTKYFYTWSRQKQASGFELATGSGVHLVDGDGNEWLDLGSLSYQANLGLGHPRMVAALQAQVARLSLAPPNAEFAGKAELAEELLALAPPGFDRVFFTSGGAEATENAIKMARMVTGHYKVLSRYRSYHGATLGALAVSGDYRRPAVAPMADFAVRMLDCYCDRCPFGHDLSACSRECATQLDEILPREGGVGAVILEPVPGANGVLVPPEDYWPRVRAACDRHGALLIADEVLTGMGRTGRALAVDHWNVVPDMITLAKGLTAGYAPMGAVLVHERVSSHFDEETLFAGLTNYGHPLGIAAAREALAVYRDENLFDRAREMGAVLQVAVSDLAAAYGERAPFARSMGLLAALELEIDSDAFDRLSAELREQRLIVHLYPDRGTLILAPALNIAEDVLGDGLSRLRTALRAALG